MTSNYAILQPARLRYFTEMVPALTPGELRVLRVQLKQSHTFALIAPGGGVFCAGGFWPNPAFPERLAWMLWADRPPARAMVEGVREIIRSLPPGPPINAYCDARRPNARKYLELVGFRMRERQAVNVSSAPPDAPTLPPEVIRMEWPECRSFPSLRLA